MVARAIGRAMHSRTWAAVRARGSTAAGARRAAAAVAAADGADVDARPTHSAREPRSNTDVVQPISDPEGLRIARRCGAGAGYGRTSERYARAHRGPRFRCRSAGRFVGSRP